MSLASDKTIKMFHSDQIKCSDRLHQRPSIGASGPPASCLWPLNCYSFIMCFGWFSMCTPGLVSMPTIHRQLGHSPLRAQRLTFTSVFEAVCVFTFCRGKRLKMACFQVNYYNKVDSENRRLKEIGTSNLRSFSLQSGLVLCRSRMCRSNEQIF